MAAKKPLTYLPEKHSKTANNVIYVNVFTKQRSNLNEQILLKLLNIHVYE